MQLFILDFTHVQYCSTTVYSPIFQSSAVTGLLTHVSLKDGGGESIKT